MSVIFIALIGFAKRSIFRRRPRLLRSSILVPISLVSNYNESKEVADPLTRNDGKEGGDSKLSFLNDWPQNRVHDIENLAIFFLRGYFFVLAFSS